MSIRIAFTATPLGIGDMHDELVVAGVNSELRKCGAHLPCKVFAPTEMDTSSLKRQKIGEDFSSGEIRSIWAQEIYGNVVEHHKRLNPELKPALLMAPGVKEAVWFAQEYEKRGIPAAAVDGKEIWFRGEAWASNRENRKKVLDALLSGEIKVICNRFVYREAIDIPELFHLILACPIGSLLSYIQTVGRVLRYHPSLDHVIVQDHGGNWHRHGSPNEDRDWRKYWKLDPTVATRERHDRMREKTDPEPICCPQCQQIRAGGRKCQTCGYESKRSVRPVIQVGGSLNELTGDVYRKRRTTSKPADLKAWESMFHRMKRAGKTFAQARGLFAHENWGVFPDRGFPLMPKEDIDLYRKIEDVPRSDLIG